jgi:hypothetical protein
MNERTSPSNLRAFLLTIFLLVGGSLCAGSLELEPKEMAPPPNITSSEPWYFNIGLPGWLTFVSGETGLRGVSSNVNVSFNQIIRRVQSVFSLSAEARKGRFGIYGDFFYGGLGATVYPGGLVSSANLNSDQWVVDGEIYYRLLEGSKGSLDLRAGGRYTDSYSSLKLSPNGPRIDEAATEFVNAANSDLRGLLERLLHGILDDKNPPFPFPPLGFDEKARLLKLIILARRHPATAHEVIRTVLRRELNRRFSLTERWADPYIGAAARYNMSKAFYLTGRVDVGGFGVASDITTQGTVAVGCEITRNIYAELGFRYLYTNYTDDSNGFLYKITTYGPQVTIGVSF